MWSHPLCEYVFGTVTTITVGCLWVLCSIEYRVSSTKTRVSSFNWISRKHRIRSLLILETRDSNLATLVVYQRFHGDKYNQHINSCIPQPSHQTSGIHTSPPFFNHTTTPQTDYQNSLRRPRVPLLRSCCHSVNTDTLCCNSLALFKRSLKTFLFRHTFRPSSSRITRL